MSNDNLLILIDKLGLELQNKKYFCKVINQKQNKMSDFKHKPGSGSIFKNNYKEKETQPDYKGTCVLQDGTEQQVAIWIKEGNNGKYFSMALSDVYKKEESTAKETIKEDNDLPF